MRPCSADQGSPGNPPIVRLCIDRRCYWGHRWRHLPVGRRPPVYAASADRYNPARQHERLPHYLQTPTPPIAPVRASSESPQGARPDPYYWLRDDTGRSPRYWLISRRERLCGGHAGAARRVRRKLYEEIVARVKQDDSSVPFRFRGYWYATHYVAGRQYPLIVRWPEHVRTRRRYCSTATSSRRVIRSFISAAMRSVRTIDCWRTPWIRSVGANTNSGFATWTDQVRRRGDRQRRTWRRLDR